MSVFKTSMVANGNIAPSRFVTGDTTAENRCTQATAGGKCIGISQEGTRYAPWDAIDDGYAAIAGEELEVYTVASECYLEIGGTVTRFDRLKADSDGKGVTTTTNLDEYGAIALQSGTSGMLIKVKVQPHSQISAA